ncbi:gene transfer agent family protein [Paracoccus tibetensis]|uniref:Phage tail tube protein, GTA-gp10 n=1 Tax=Paracoccus tibetensis TaxID=336292 RepID=A0A1G5H3C7_9RHOB|nr:gene transfer agent family protein [Paracoccus tibetensis]SCY58382.1 Phage tail tube protein, GTA-gp10 [Paracoccus tibetensis]
MANPLRGEVEVILDGAVCNARLTLGALAALEHELGAGSLLDLAERFESSRFTGSDVIAVLAAGLRGGGWIGGTEDLLRADIAGGPMAAARAAAQLLALAFRGPA